MCINRVLFISLLDLKRSNKRCPEAGGRMRKVSWLKAACVTWTPFDRVISTSGTRNSREDSSSVSFLFNGKLEFYLTSDIITHCIDNSEGWCAEHRWLWGAAGIDRMVRVISDVGRSYSDLPAWHKRRSDYRSAKVSFHIRSHSTCAFSKPPVAQDLAQNLKWCGLLLFFFCPQTSLTSIFLLSRRN